MKLSLLQNQFQSYLLTHNHKINAVIVETEKVPTELRLKIYRDAYTARLIEALESTYTALKIYLGDDAFYDLSMEYIQANPSPYRSIRWYGDQFPLFLQNHEDYSEYPYLAELAAIEWTMTLVFDAADKTNLTIEQMTLIPAAAWEKIKLEFHPSLHFLKLSWNVFEIWQALSESQELNEAAINEATIPEPILSESPIQWVLWRHELIHHYSSLTLDQAKFINIMYQGAEFSTLCEAIAQSAPNDQSNPNGNDESAVITAVTLLKEWVNSGMIVSVSHSQ